MYQLVLSLLLILFLTSVGFLLRSRWRRKNEVILFIDAPDPDNAAAALALWRHVMQEGKRGCLRIVLTGRPVDLRTSKRLGDSLPISNQILRQSWETDVPEHAERLLEDSAQRLANYLHKCGVPHNAYVIYHGGIAPEAPLSDAVHDWDFLFDRRDLATGRQEERGEIVAPKEYESLVSRFCHLSEEQREAEILSHLRCYPLAPLDELRSLLSNRDCSGIKIFLGGPATALLQLFSGRNGCTRLIKVKEFFGMFGSLNPGKTTLLPNQFNVACDLQAAKEVFCNDDFLHVDKYLVTTETCKQHPLVVSAQEMEGRGMNPYVVKLQRLWEATHKNVPQPMFDVIPVMASLERYKSSFVWARKKAELCQQRGTASEVFQFADCEIGTLYVSGEEVQLGHEAFLQFLAYTY